MTSMPDHLLPSRADLDAATARTAAVMADPAASLSDRLLAAEAEEATHHAYLQRPGKDAELQADAEREAERAAMATGPGSRQPENQPIPYMLTGKAQALLATAHAGRVTVRRQQIPHRPRTLTTKAEAVHTTQGGSGQAL
jgi:hypothetical protein